MSCDSSSSLKEKENDNNSNNSITSTPINEIPSLSSCSESSSSSSSSSLSSKSKKKNDDAFRLGWWKWIISIIVSSSSKNQQEQYRLNNKNKNGKHDSFEYYSSRVLRWLLCSSSSTVAMTLVGRWFWLYYHQRNKSLSNHQNNKNNNNKNSPPPFPWYPKRISSLVETPFALAFDKVKKGYIVPPLYMNEVDQQIVFYDKTDKSWKRSTNNNHHHHHSSSKDQMQQLVSHVLSNTSYSSGGAAIELLPQSKIQKYKGIALQILLSSSPFLYLIAMYYMLQKLYKEQQSTGSSWEDPQNQDNDTITLQDVAGMESLISELSYLYEDDDDDDDDGNRARNIGRKTNNTHVLLYGPPGNGKTLLARALANSLYQRGIVDAVQCCNASDFVELYVGQGAKRVRSIFGSLKKRASQNYSLKNKSYNKSFSFYRWSMMMNWLFPYHRPIPMMNDSQHHHHRRRSRPVAILIMDELDALAKSRQGMNHDFSTSSHGNDEREQTLLALLTELDSALLIHTTTTNKDNNNDNNSPIVLVIGATNRPNVLDPAFVRRFSKQVLISNPDNIQRLNILQHYYNLSHLQHQNNNISLTDLIPLTEKFSASDLQQVFQQAEWIATMEQQQQQQQRRRRLRQLKSSSSTAIELSQTHLEEAIQKILSQKSNISNYIPSFHNY